MLFTKSDLEARVKGNKLDLRDFGLFNNDLAMIAVVVNERNVDHLILHRNNLDDEGGPIIANCRNLRVLDLSYNNFTNQCLSDILTIPTLQILDLSRTAITDEGVDVMLEIRPPSLTIINLERTQVTNAAVIKLQDALILNQNAKISLRM